jgi:hypothetical protein
MTRVALGLVLFLAGCATSAPLVEKAPPAVQDEQPTKKPASHVFWQHGHWAWDESKQLYYWEAGGWVPERQDEVWIPGYWTRVEDGGQIKGWTWVDERWEPKAR